MYTSFRYLLIYIYIIFNAINRIQTAPQGYLLGASYNPGSASNTLYKIDPLTGKFTVFTPLTNYKAYDVTYDFINKIFYVFGSQAMSGRESSVSVMIVNPFNATKTYRTITTEPDAEIFGMRVDSSTGKLYSLQKSEAFESPTSIVQIDPHHFIAKRWVNITKANGVQPDSMAFFFNSTDHQYFVTVPYGSDDVLVGIDVMRREIISEISTSNLPSYLCYDNKTNAFYGIQEVQGRRACRLVRLNPYNGTMNILSRDFNDYLSSTGTCYGGFYFTMIVQKLDTQKIVTFDLKDNGKMIANSPAETYLDAFAFVPI